MYNKKDCWYEIEKKNHLFTIIYMKRKLSVGVYSKYFFLLPKENVHKKVETYYKGPWYIAQCVSKVHNVKFCSGVD